MNGLDLAPAPKARSARLYVLCLLWGLATGAVAGGLTGAILAVVSGLGGGVVDTLVVLPLLGAIYGVAIGTVLALLPSALGALALTVVVRVRHPHPVAEDAVRRDVGVVVCAVVGALDAAVLLAIFLGDGLSSVARSFPFIVVANAVVAPILWAARASIAQAWSDT